MLLRLLTNFSIHATIKKIHREDSDIVEKTKQLLAYLVCRYTSVPITGLMKLAYLSDLVSIKKNNEPISDFQYIRYKYGPFDNNIYNYIHELLSEKIITEEPAYSPLGDEYIIYKFNHYCPE